MFIVRQRNQSRLKPHRGGMAGPDVRHAAPTELERNLGGAVATNMSLLRSWPNERPGADAGWRVLCAFQRPWPRAAQAER